MHILAIVLFVLIFILILKGYPVAFTLGGISLIFALIVHFIYPEDFPLSLFNLLPSRLMGIVNNYVLMAVPMFVLMGMVLEKSGLAKELLEVMTMFFGSLKGGLAISVVVVGAMLGASTGIVGATVVTMGLISLPTMISRGYNKELATGVICASGTLGQIIPPSVVLVLLADTINSVSRGKQSADVGAMFSAAIIPGIILVGAYILYVVILSFFKKNHAPCIPKEEIKIFMNADNLIWRLIKVLVLPFSLIFLVLGSIFMGLASPTEASAIGASGAILLTILQKKFNFKMLKESLNETTKLTSMVFFILVGATTFTLVFRGMGGDVFLENVIREADISPMLFLLIVMLVIFISGFFIDFIEIIFIFIPVVTPIFNFYGMDMLWIGILVALNLQTSFLTPPFGFALFYLKAVAPPEIKTIHLYKGVVPFILIQILVIALVMIYPQIIYMFK